MSFLQDLTGFKFEVDIFNIVRALKSVPGQERLAADISWFDGLVQLAKAYALVVLDLSSHPDRKDRKVNATRVEQLTSLRMSIKHADDAMGKVEDLFTATDGKPQFDASKFPDFLKECKELVREVSTYWAADMDDLCNLVKSYIRDGWDIHRDRILEEDCASVLQAVLQNTQASQDLLGLDPTLAKCRAEGFRVHPAPLRVESLEPGLGVQGAPR